MVVTRLVALAVGLLATLGPLSASTLQRLSLDEMILKSTAIIRGKIVSSRSMTRGPLVYTVAQVEVAERWKGPRATRLEVAIPGGVYRGERQTFSGTPKLEPDTDYILFLWTGPSGVTQVIGLAQGVFTVVQDAQGQDVVERPAATGAVMVDAKGSVVEDEAVSMKLGDLKGRVERMIAGEK